MDGMGSALAADAVSASDDLRLRGGEQPDLLGGPAVPAEATPPYAPPPPENGRPG